VAVGVPVFTLSGSTRKGIFEIDYAESDQKRHAKEMIDQVILSNSIDLPDAFHEYVLKFKNPAFA